MNIYLKVEIRRREFEARLLLGLVAAERGHDVLLGDFSALLSHRLWLEPGVFHDKSLTPNASKSRLHADLAAAGFVVSSQDEEHGLGDEDYQSFALRRFGDSTLSTATTVCCWGEHDAASLRETYPRFADRFLVTGSPRVDLWQPDLAQRLPAARPLGDEEDRPYVLVAPGSRPFIPNPFWTTMEDLRPRQFRGLDDEREWGHYEKFAEAYRYVGRLVRTIRLATTEVPDLLFVVRPHPKSPDGAWEGVLGELPNVLVDRSGDAAGPWLRDAVALVHNGSTTGAEAAMMGVPVISFQPNGERSGRFTNRIGEVAGDEASLLARLRDLARERRHDTSRTRTVAAHDLEVLGERLAHDAGVLNADRIVDAWERHDHPSLQRPNAPRAALLKGRAHQRAGTLRHGARQVLGRKDGVSPAIDTTPKFPPVTDDDLVTMVAGLRASLDRFAGVTVERLDGRLARIRRT